LIKPYVQAARLRTLPLSVSGIILGSLIAASESYFNWKIFVLAIFTTVGFQVLSNFANDYGDAEKGADNEDRVGPKRAMQSGLISPKQMLRAIVIATIITFIFALLLIYQAFGVAYINYSIVFVILGVASIIAAIKYTVGKRAYGYSGFGDVFVFLFFGWLSVIGSYFLYAKQLDWRLFLPASAIGLLSVGVLNLNNMRDSATDKSAGKNTLVVKLGDRYAKYYHYALLIGSLVLLLIYVFSINYKPSNFIFLVAYIPIIKHLIVVFKNKNPQELDGELKKLALSTFLVAVLVGVGLIL